MQENGRKAVLAHICLEAGNPERDENWQDQFISLQSSLSFLDSHPLTVCDSQI